MESDTEQRLDRIEQRIEAIETVIADAHSKLTAWSQTPTARKLARMFGVNLT